MSTPSRKSPLSAAYQKRLRSIVGQILSGVSTGHIAEAIAAGYGLRSHNALAEAVKSAESAQEDPGRRPFDVARVYARLKELGHDVPALIDPLLKSLLEIQAPEELPDTVPPLPQESLGRIKTESVLQTAMKAASAGHWDAAAAWYGVLMSGGNSSAKAAGVEGLKSLSTLSDTAAAYYATALLMGDGCRPDPVQAEAIFRRILASESPNACEAAHNWLGHIAHGAFGGRPSPAAAVEHFEASGRLGNAEAAYNAGILFEQGGRGLRKQEARAVEMFRLAAGLGHVAGTTNYAISLLATDPDQAVTLLERSAARGDAKAKSFLSVVDRASIRMFGGGR